MTTTAQTRTNQISTTEVSTTGVGVAVSGAPVVDVVSGPHTIVALGEDCLVCEEGLEPGQVYVFCRDATRAGIAHEESCTDPVGTDDTARMLP